MKYVLALALILRLLIPALGYLTAPGGPLVREPDSPGYIRAAEELVRLGRFGRPGEPELMRTPGYPLLLAPGVWLACVERAAIGLQIGLGCLTTWLVYRLGQLTFERDDWALAGALAYACEPLSALYCSKLLSETLFTATIAAATVFVLRFVRRGANRDWLASASLFAAATYVRPIAYFLPIVVALSVLLSMWSRAPSKGRLLLQASGFLCLACGLVAAWQVRNYVEAGYPKFSAISDINLYYYQAAGVLAAERGAPLGEVQKELGYGDDEVYFRLHPAQRSWSQTRRLAFLRREAVRIIRERPGLMLKVQLAGVFGMLADVGTNAYLGFFRLDDDRDRPRRLRADESSLARLRRAFREKPLPLAFHGLLCAALLSYWAGGVAGAICGRVWRNPAARLLIGISCYFLVLSGGPVGSHRFRLPIVPVISLLAGCGAASGLAAARRFRSRGTGDSR
ncbi:MAG TPA: glycosyltransferase family 39 protein [Pirellulales bacterium]|nr:glycosyltransferase family 39 protein [Pirellulales bacterium]